MKKKIIGIVCASVATVVLSALLATGILMFIQDKNVAETGNVLGVSWYNEADTEFTITTVKELYEFADLAKFYDFKDQTIKLGADIIVNEGNAADWAETAPEKRWRPINKFAGTFDGQGHTISGLYAKVFGAKLAMFTNTNASCVIQNVRLVNTYFESGGLDGMASFVSSGGGKFYKLYSDAILECTGENVGGLASLITSQSTFEECWFDGSIHITNRDCGGLIDEISGARVNMRHCLFSGTIEQEYTIGGTRTGAICGRVLNSGALILEDCLASGTLTATKTIYTGAMVGVVYAGCQITTMDSYVSSDVYHLMVGDSGEQGTINSRPLQMIKDVLVGIKAYEWTTLDFDNYWAAVEGGTPVLKCFGEEGLPLAGVEKAFDSSWYKPGVYNYELTTLKQLYGLYILSGGNNFSGCTIKLGADIVVNSGDAKKWEESAPVNPWFPINSFAGVFDGQGHTISGVYLKNNMTYQGLFSQVHPTGILKNFKLKNSYFCNTNTGKLAMMGSIAGEFRGTLENVYSDALVVSYGNQVGGIFGRTNDNDSDGKEDRVVIKDCWFDGELRMKGDKVQYGGGFVGMVVQGDLDILHCLNTATCSSEATGTGVHLGGFIGSTMNKGVINMTDCLSAGKIEVVYRICVGSVFGRATNEERTVNLTNVYATKESYDVVFFGMGEGGSTTAVINGGIIPISETLLAGYKAYQWTALDFAEHWAVVEDSTPILKGFASSVPSLAGQKKMINLDWYKADAKEYELKTVEELCGFALVSGGDSFKGKTIKLSADIVVNSGKASDYATNAPEKEWLSIGSSFTQFQGIFDGQGHTVSGIYLDTEDTYNGFFGIAGAGSVIKNFKLTNSYFCYSGTKTAVLGSVVGELNGQATLENVYSDATVVSYGSQAGGLVGRVNDKDNDTDKETDKAIIQNCWFDGEFSLKGEATQYGGGLVGRIFRGDLDMAHCLNTGSVSSEAMNTGLHLGGLIGAANDYGTLNLKDSLNTGSVSVKYNNCVGSLLGRVTAKNRNVNIEGSYALENSYKTLVGSVSQATVNSDAIFLSETELTGLEPFKWTELNLNYWVAIENGTPELRYFSTGMNMAGVEKMYDTSWYKETDKNITITTQKQLYGLAILSRKHTFKGQIFLLGNELDMSAYDRWVSIGNTSKPFEGTFDGQNYAIKNMTQKTATQYAGLFGYTKQATIQNVIVKDSTFESTLSGNAYLGGLIGGGNGKLLDSYSNANVISAGPVVGGLIGRSTGYDIRGCWYDGAIAVNYTGAEAANAGGLLGTGATSKTTIDNCAFTGTLDIEFTSTNEAQGYWRSRIGGIVGSDGAAPIVISNVMATGNVTAIWKHNNDTGVSTPSTLAAIHSAVGYVDSAETATKGNVYISSVVTAKVEDKNKTSNPTAPYTLSDKITDGIAFETISMSRANLLGVEAYRCTDLDFESSNKYWAARSENVPGIYKFVNNPLSLAGVIKPDTSWYDADEIVQQIWDEADMYGFMKLLVEGNTFKDKQIYLMNDIELNEIESGTVDKWKAGTETPVNKWSSSKSDGPTQFAGTFDGQMHKISGIYMNTSVAGAGLFGEITSTGKVSNLYIKESFFKSTAASLGSVAGISHGTISTVFSDAVIVSNQVQAGGIVGYMKSNLSSVDHCWFDGEITLSTRNGKQSGGIVGYISDKAGQTFNITDCLYTGDLIYEAIDTSWALRIGGIAGGAWDYRQPIVNLENCVSAGTITHKSGSTESLGVSSVYGGLDGATITLNFVNVYGTKECYEPDRIYDKKVDGPTIKGTGILMAESDLYGAAGYQKTLLDFEDTWVARIGDVPALKVFSKEIPTASVADLTGYEQNQWYNSNETVFGIGSVSALKSLSTYVEDSAIKFQNKTIYLTDDIEVNKVEEGTLAAWKAGTGTLPTSWKPIGHKNDFNGTFDGRMHTISGVYMKVTNNTNASRWYGYGLFGKTGYNSTVQNLLLVDSYFEIYDSNGHANDAGYIANLGSIAGYHHGYLKDVYSNATIVSNRKQVGGIMGYSNSRGVSNVWYDGTITVSSAHGREAGGIVGCMDSNNTFENILFTGSISYNTDRADTGIGGIIGITYASSTCTPTLKNVISAGKIVKGTWAGSGNGVVGSVVGIIYKATVKTENVYATTDLWNVTHNIASGGTGTISGTVTTPAEANLYGDLAKTNAAALDYTNAWVIREDKVPALKAFSEMIK